MAISSQYKPIGANFAASKDRSPSTSVQKPRLPMKELVVLLGAVFFIVVISWQATPSLTRSQLAPAPIHERRSEPVQAPTQVNAHVSHVQDARPLTPHAQLQANVPDGNHLLAHLLIDDACLVGAKACTGNVESLPGSHHTVVRACSAGFRSTACECFGLNGPLAFKSTVVSKSALPNQCSCTFVSDAPPGIARWAMDIACRPL